MEDIRLGDYCSLTIVKQVDFGLYLDGGKAGEILLPLRYVPQNISIGNTIKVFIYLDQEERLIATTENPIAKVGDFAYLKVNWVNEYGAFLDWGLMKDLFCPFGEQKKKMQKGESYVVYIHVDENSFRIVASAKVDKFINKDVSSLMEGKKVEILVWEETDLGFKVIINNHFAGLVYDTQIFTPIHIGDHLYGFIQNIRADGKVDVSLQKTGRQQTIDFSQKLLDYLYTVNGYCPYDDKTNAQKIYETFHVSKKVFKKSVGDLYRQHKITIEADGLHLVQPFKKYK